MKGKPSSFSKYLLSVSPDPGWRASYGWLVFMLALALAALLSNRLNPDAFAVLRLWTNDRLLPVMRAIAIPFRSAETFVDDAFLLLQADQEIERLKNQLALMHLQQDSLLSIISENKVLREQLNLIDKPLVPEARVLTARVLVDQSGYFRHSIIASAGAKHGVSINDAVVYDGHLIGKVTHVTEEIAQILLLFDLNSQIPVLVLPGRQRAILSGNNSQTLALKYLPNLVGIEEGMLIFTSGDEGIIPYGILTGRISYVDRENAKVLVKTQIGLDQLEYLQILINPEQNRPPR